MSPTAARLALAAGLLFFAGCAELDKTVSTAERAIAVARSPTARTLAKGSLEVYERDPQKLIDDLRQAQRDYQRLVDLLNGNVNRTWGKKETRLPERTVYVKYTQNYLSRALVDFDAGRVTVETLDAKDPKRSLRNAIVTTLLTPDDPRSVDLYSDSAVKLSSERPPYLKGLVLDHRGREIAAPAQAEAFADHLLAGAKSRTVTTDAGAKPGLFVQFAMVANLANKQAEKYRPTVAKVAAQYKVSQSLVFAIIRTESNFNPFAVSSAPAYGLMQLVPASGGREAHRRARGSDRIPTKEELFDADRNIEFGTAYLNVLLFRQLEMVDNAVSREYCVISAYNTGPSNVLRTFNKGNPTAAVNEINKLEPSAVYEKLRTGLPYAETRDYLQKVVGFRRQFVTAGQ